MAKPAGPAERFTRVVQGLLMQIEASRHAAARASALAAEMLTDWNP
jgi:hypothetical protein